MTDERTERRLAAILAADVVGYSRLVSADETGALALLTRLRREIIEPQIARHSGRLFKIMGDGFLAEFASAVQATTCALTIQREAEAAFPDLDDGSRMRLRIGIHVGDVVVDGDDLMGDGVNIAARLESVAVAGGISISRAVHDLVRDRIEATFDDKGDVALKNIGRPVQVFAVAGAKPAGPAKTPAPTLVLSDRPSIAVLPFQNMSGDPEQEYFADGIVEDVITALSRFKSLFVIARNSSFTFKGKAVDIKEVARQLGVRYVVEGSVRKSGQRVRITSQLIDGTTGAHLWADKFDGALADLFDLQDQITAKVVSSLAPTIERAELERLKQRPTSTTDSYDIYLRGMGLYYRSKYAQARTLFKQAIELDPENAAAHAMAAYTIGMEKAVQGTIPVESARADAMDDVNSALKITNDDAFVLARCAWVLAYVGGELDRGSLLVERAVALNPNLSTAWLPRGWISLMVSDPQRSIESFETVLRLSPLDPLRPFSLSGLAFGYFFLDRYDEGRRVGKEIVESFPHIQSFSSYICNCVGAADLIEAKRVAGQLMRFDPSFRVSRAASLFITRAPELRLKLDDAFRAAGLPE